MPKSARDRIHYPTNTGSWARPSGDVTLQPRELVYDILHNMGDLIDAIESSDTRIFLRVKWNHLRGVTSQGPSPALIANFMVDKANSISAAYSGALRRHREGRTDIGLQLEASDELVDFFNVIERMFRKSSAQNVLEQSLKNTESFQNMIDLLEQHSSKVVSSYDAIYPENPPPGSALGVPGATPQRSASGSDTAIPSPRRASWWERWRNRSPSS